MKAMFKGFMILLVTIMLSGSLFWSARTAAISAGTEEVEFSYKNPVKSAGADPWMCYKDGFYYYTETTAANITLRKSETLVGIGTAKPKVIWTPPANTAYSNDLWAPELHFLDGKWYIYFAAGGAGNEYSDQRMWVLQSETDDAMGKYKFLGKLGTPDDCFAIDGSVIQYNNKLYFTWSGEPVGGGKQNIYIASMSNPWTLSSERILLSQPDYEWEKRGGRPWINEGPSALYNKDRLFIVYSASGSWSDYYCLGLLTFNGGNILSPSSWTKSDKPVFETGNGIYAPGHSSYVKSPDKTEDWIVYHSARSKGSGWDRVVRAQKFTWNTDGTPHFGVPLADGKAYIIPSAKGVQTKNAPLLNGKAYKITSVIKTNNQENYLELIQDGDGLKLVTRPWKNTDSQKWMITKTGIGTMAVKNVAYDAVLTVDNNALSVKPFGDSAAQKWNVLYSEDGYFEFSSVYDGSSIKLVNTNSGNTASWVSKGGTRYCKWSFELIADTATQAPTTAPTAPGTTADSPTGTLPASTLPEVSPTATLYETLPAFTDAYSSAPADTASSAPAAASSGTSPFVKVLFIIVPVLLLAGMMIYFVFKRKKQG